MKKSLVLVAAALALTAGFTTALTARYGATASFVPAAPHVAIPAGAAERLAGAIRIPTISAEDEATFDGRAFEDLHAYLESVFPLVHARLQRETVGRYGLLYTWAGADPALEPILLAGHLDVVPVEPGTEGRWHHEPFAGRISDGFIWGRGAIDDKAGVLGTLEAVEMLLGEGYRPARTVYLAYGDDEEVGGLRGAREIASLLERRGVRLEMVLDEGGVVGDRILPGIADPVALVGVAEKGFATIELSTRVSGGHSSMPPRQTAVGIIGAAVAKLEEHPMPARLDGPTRQLVDRIGPRFPIPGRLVFANLWLTQPLVIARMEERPATNAMVRTTTAPTISEAGTRDNVLPGYARAVINARILPGDSVSAVVEHVRRVIDDERVDVALAGRFTAEPSAVSSTATAAFRTVERSIRSAAPDVIVAPYLVAVATDARHYGRLSDNVFRFLPIRLTPSDLERIHGVDERIGIREYESAVRTYRRMIIDASRGEDGTHDQGCGTSHRREMLSHQPR
jgi:carboxypeptidase PM20D1